MKQLFKKTNRTIAISSAILMASVTSVFAQTTIRNGGDPVELKFEYARSELTAWIQKTELRNLNLFEQNAQALSKKLLQAMGETRVVVSDEIHYIDNTFKVCVNFPASKVIECNKRQISNMTYEDLLSLVFHEYLGIVGVESNKGAKSDYRISNQLFLYMDTTTKLGLQRNARFPVNIVGTWDMTCRDGNTWSKPSKFFVSKQQPFQFNGADLYSFYYTAESGNLEFQNRFIFLSTSRRTDGYYQFDFWRTTDLSPGFQGFDSEHSIILSYSDNKIQVTGDHLEEAKKYECILTRE